MSAELEAVLLDGAATTRRPRHGPTRPPGSPCANCGAILQGAWCHDCGQLAEDFHRSIWRLMMEAVEGITHLDGRFWTTSPALFLRPAKLTRDYIEGHRAAQIPPLRLFLVVLLLVFFIGSVTGGKTEFFRMNGAEDPAARSRTEAQIDKINVDFGDHSQVANAWLRPRLKAVLRDPERFKLVLEGQSERFAFLTLPLATLLLSLLFVFQRRFYIFDHTIFALHSLSFQGLLFSVSALAGTLWHPLSSLLLLGAPVHLFVHLRGVYRTGIAGTLLRMALLGVGSAVGFIVLLLLLVFVGLSAMG